MEKIFTYKIHPVKPFGSTEEIDTGFVGEIKVKIPDYKTGMKMVKEQQALDDDFEKVSAAAFDTCEKHIESMTLSHPDAGEIDGLADLANYQEGVAVMFDVYSQILRGWSLSPKIGKPLIDK